jgi:hypothetical protein
MWISKTYLRIAAVSLLSLVSAAQVWAQENGGEIDSFNRNLGLEGMGTDLANVEHELEHGSPTNTTETSNTQGSKKAPVQKKAPTQRTASFSDLAFQSNGAVTNTMRAYWVTHVNTTTLINAPAYDTLISRFDTRFANYGYSKHNVGDAIAGYLIVTWEILHNADASNTPAGIRRVRQAVCQLLEQRGKAARLTSENKQKLSELLKCLAELGREEVKSDRQTNNQADIQKVQKQLNLIPLKFDIDLSRYQLTDQGFIKG